MILQVVPACVLVACDDAVSECVVELLLEAGYTVSQVGTPELVEHIGRLLCSEAPLPCCLLLDVRPPWSIGSGWIARLEQDPSLDATGIVLMIADAMDRVPRRHDVLHKPFGIEELVRAVARQRHQGWCPGPFARHNAARAPRATPL